MKIKTKIMVITLLLVITPILTISIGSYIQSSSIIDDMTSRTYQQMSGHIANSIERDLSGYLYGVEAIAQNVNAKEIMIQPDYEPFLRDLFVNYVESYPAAFQIYIGTEDRGMRIEPHVEFDEDYDPTIRPWYTRAKESRASGYTDLYEDIASGSYSVAASAPVYYQNEFVGAVSTSLDLSKLSENYSELEAGLDGYTFVIDHNKTIVIHPDKRLVGGELAVTEINGVIDSGSEQGSVFYDFEGDRKVAYYTYLPSNGWYVFTSMYESEIRAASNAIGEISVVSAVVFIVLAIIVCLFFANSITKPIKGLVASMKQVERGDMTAQYQHASKDEMGILSTSFTKMVGNIKALIHETAQVTNQVRVSSEGLAAGAEQTSVSTEEVARTVEEIAEGAASQASDAEDAAERASLLDKKLDELSDNSKTMSKNAENVQKAGSHGAEKLEVLKQAADKNIVSTDNISEAVYDLESKSKDIGDIIQTISSIADQTNLLALNASIEAARAGEHGRGFSVVADEIRKLAEESADSASKIGDLVKMIQNQTGTAVEMVSDVKKNANEQHESVKDMNSSFELISNQIDEIADQIQKSDSFVEDIVNAKNEIVEAITNISSVSEETAASSQEVSATTEQQTVAVENVASSAQHLSDLSKDLEEMVGRFKV